MRNNLLRLIYVPIAMLILVSVMSTLIIKEKYDPLTVAQNPRLKFQENNPDILTQLPANTLTTMSILLIGNSQTQAIMDQQLGDKLTASWMAESLKNNSAIKNNIFSVKQDSLPNLRMIELLVKSLQAVTDDNNWPDVIIGGIVLDGFRQVEPRTEFSEDLAISGKIKDGLNQIIKGAGDKFQGVNAIRSVYKLETEARSGEATPDKGGRDSRRFAFRLEARLNDYLEAHFPLFQAREMLHGWLHLNYTYARNKLLGVSTNSPRPINPAIYRTNLELIEMCLHFLKNRGIHPVLYVAPIRPLQPNPYLPEDVARFRQDLPILCQKYDAVCLDYSGLIPEEEWTNYPTGEGSGFASQPDFAHFTGRAHQRLGRQLEQDLRPYLEKWLAQKKKSRSNS